VWAVRREEARLHTQPLGLIGPQQHARAPMAQGPQPGSRASMGGLRKKRILTQKSEGSEEKKSKRVNPTTPN
jgi:hypothetical protein